MLYITHDSTPALRCAVCELPIFSAEDASVVFPRGLAPGNMHPVSLAHSDYCRSLVQEHMETGAGPGLAMTLIEYGNRLRASNVKALASDD